jgi:regulator of protease activity HflC (stomatin/prohibitin superfamily)
MLLGVIKMDGLTLGLLIAGGILLLIIIFTGFRVVRPYEKGLVERFGKYNRLADAGLNFLIPLGIEKMYLVNLTEKMVNSEPNELITLDKLNVMVDSQVYYKVRNDEQSIKDSQYNVFSYEYQIVNLARTTLRNIIGTMTLNDANSGRDKINSELMTALKKETGTWGIDVVRTELKEVTPPKDVQVAMNKVVIAQNEKQSAVDFALAKQTEADGMRMAKVKESEGQQQYLINIAEGEKKATILKSEGQQQAFKNINESFTGNAQILRKLEVAENSLRNNVKYIVPVGSNLVNVVSDSADVKLVPFESKKDVPSPQIVKPDKKVM